MKILFFIMMLALLPLSAKADFSLNGNTAAKAAPASASSPRRIVKKPALEIINERYVPEEIQKKYEGNAVSAPTPSAPVNLPLPGEETLAAAPAKPAPEAMEVAAMPPMKSIVVSPPKALVVEDAVKAPPPVPVPDTRFDTWRARKGEPVKDVLKRWSDRAGAEFVWTASKTPKVEKEFSFVGTFEEASSKLIAQNPAGLKTTFADDVNTAVNPVANNIPNEIKAGPQNLPTPIVSDEITYRDMTAPVVAAPKVETWSAAQDASLETVLKDWADKEGASLIWQAPEAFKVKKPVSQSGQFEGAVTGLLTQFDTQKTRPVGQLYKNPISGEKVLVIRLDNAG